MDSLDVKLKFGLKDLMVSECLFFMGIERCVILI